MRQVFGALLRSVGVGSCAGLPTDRVGAEPTPVVEPVWRRMRPLTAVLHMTRALSDSRRLRPSLVPAFLVTVSLMVSGCTFAPLVSHADQGAEGGKTSKVTSPGGSVVPSKAAPEGQVQIKAPTTQAAFLAAWNRLASEEDPFASVESVQRSVQPSNKPGFIAQVGWHVFLAGSFDPHDYSVDIWLDHPVADVGQAGARLLPYWKMLLTVTQPNLQSTGRQAILAALGLTTPGLTIPSRFTIGAKSYTVNGVTYLLSYQDGLVLSAEHGPQATIGAHLDANYKSITVLAAGQSTYPVSGEVLTSHLKRLHGPGPYRPGRGDAEEYQWFRDLAAWTYQALELTVSPMPSTTALMSKSGMDVLRQQLGVYYTAPMMKDLIGGETWANLAEGTVEKGSLAVQGHASYYGLGRVFILDEPPFKEGATYDFQYPLWADGTTYQLGWLKSLADSARLEKMSVQGPKVTLTVATSRPGATGTQQATFSFTTVQGPDQVWRVETIDTPPCACE